MTKICQRQLVLLMLLLAFASTTMISSHGRPLPIPTSVAQELDEEQHKSSVLERDEMVRMAGYGEEKLSTVLITGTVVCNSQLPMSGVLVAVTCHSQTNNTELTEGNGATAVTDRHGEFIVDLPSELHAIHNLEKACSVNVLKLPKNSPCSQSKVGREHKEIRLLSADDSGIRTYAAKTITFKGTIPKGTKA